MSAWPEPVERVATFLRDTGGEARIEEFPAGTQTAQDAADAVGCKLEQIVKSLVLECDGQIVLAMVPGDRRATAKVAAAAGVEAAAVVPAKRAAELTGFPPGGISPFGLPRIAAAFVDNRLLLTDRVWVGAGSPHHVAGLPPAELLRLSRATAVDISADL